jgi:hypothetical protein
MRKFLAIALGLTFMAFAPGDASARDGFYRSVNIDTSRIAATGHRHLAQALKPMLAGELSKALGPRLGNRGAPLTVRITYIRIPPNAGEENSQGLIEDTLMGVVLVPGRAPIPIRVVLPPSNAGAWYARNFDERRVFRLIEAFAQWTAREV